jgi:hypothetical protein
MIDKIRTDHLSNTEYFEVSCDKCSYSKKYEVDHGWSDLLEQMKEDRWVNKRVNNEWENICSICSENT